MTKTLMILIAALTIFAADAKADQKYVQSAGSSIFTIDREAGTITRQIRSSSQGTPGQAETLSCKYGYIVTVNGEATSMLDLLAPLRGAVATDAVVKRVEAARKDCLDYSITPRF